MSNQRVTIVIVTWDSMNYIFNCLESLMHQNFRDFSVIIVDNGSNDGTIEFVRTYFPTVSILQNFKNLGYARANNQGIKIAKSEYLLVLNPDVAVTQDFLSNLILFADSHPQGGSFGGKLFKQHSEDIDPGEGGGGLTTAIKSDILDSAGLKVYRNRSVVNRGENKKDQGKYDKAEEIFGVSGACVLYRKSALEDVKIKDEYFDQNFFAYKEDIDLAWRLKIYGWQSWYVPQAVAYHHRRFSKPSEKSVRKIYNSRRDMSKIVRSLSFKNHHLTLVKNEHLINFIYDFFPICWREFKWIGYSLIFEPFIWKSITIFFKQIPVMIVKRKIIFNHSKTSAKDVRKWFKN